MGSNKSTRFLCFLLMSLALPALFNPAVNAAPLGTIIYQDGFTVNGVERQYGGNLNLTTIEDSLLKWVAPGGMIFSSINGQDVVSSTVQNGNGAVINSDLSLVGGTVKIEIDAMPLGTDPADPDRTNWIAIGFQPEATPAWVINAGGISIIFRGNGGYQIFANGGDITPAEPTPVVGYTQGDVADMSIAYDSATNTATFVINGQVVFTSGNLGAFADKAKRPFVTMYDAGMWFDNFSVSMEGGVLPVMIVPQSPANGAGQLPVDTSLSWAPVFPVAEELKFDVFLDPNETLVTSLDPSTRVSSQQPGFTYTPAAPLAFEKTYYWRILPYINGEPNQPTEVRNFSTRYEVQKWSHAPWASDDDLDISPGKIYTHKVKFNAASEAFLTTVKGVQFENDTNRTGSNWSMTGAVNPYNDPSQFPGTGEGRALTNRFFYGSPSTLTLNGLTPGVQYRTTLYTHSWGDPGGRVVAVTTSDDGRVNLLDENMDGGFNGRLFMYTYTAPASGSLTFTFTETVFNASWHHYAFSNEILADIYLDPTPVPGSAVQGASDLSWILHGQVASPSYKLYVATDAAMQNLVVQQPVPGTTYHMNLNPETSYYWKVEVLDGDTLVHTSPVWNFTTLVPPDAEKVLEWKMDESSGPIAYQTGTSEDADGTLMGFNDPNASSIFVTGLVGNAILLNGTTEYVDVSVANPYMPTGNEQAFAVSGYFRTFKAYGPVFSMRNSANGTPLIDISIGHDGARESAGRLRLLVRDDGGALGPSADSVITVNDGRWHSFVVMRSRGNWAMYIDGIKRSEIFNVASGAVTLDWLTIGTEKMWVFADYGSWNGSRTDIRYFKGMLDEICVWSGEMQPHQIAELAAIVPPQGDLNFDRATDIDDFAVLTDTWLSDSFTPIQPSPVILEDMESYSDDPNTYKDHWEALNGGVSLENVYGNVATAPTSATVGSSVNSIVDDALYGKVLKWVYDVPANKTNAIQRFWLRDRRIDLAAYSHMSIRVKKLAGSTGDRFYFDFHDGRGMTNPEQGIFPWVLAWQGRIIMALADLPADQWVTLEADIPGGFNGGGRPKQIHDFYEVTIGINSAGVARAGTILIDEIVLSDSTTDCFATVGELLPDMTGDCKVNIEDFALMAANWLKGM